MWVSSFPKPNYSDYQLHESAEDKQESLDLNFLFKDFTLRTNFTLWTNLRIIRKLRNIGPASCYPGSVAVHIGTREKDDHSSEPFVRIWAIRAVLLLNSQDQPLKLKQKQKNPLSFHMWFPWESNWSFMVILTWIAYDNTNTHKLSRCLIFPLSGNEFFISYYKVFYWMKS